MKQRILIDPQVFLNQKYGGISRSYAEIWKYIHVNNTEYLVDCPLYYSENLHLMEIGLLPINFFKFLHNYSFKGLGRIKDQLKKRSIKRTSKILSNKSTDYFLCTYYDTYFLKYIGDIPLILTVYDMIHEIFPQYFINDQTTVTNKKKLLERANIIIAISENTKNDILRIYPHLKESKIKVVPLAQSIVDGKLKRDLKLPEEYILYVGNRELYKNFDFFIECATRVLKEYPSLYVVCAGGGEFKVNEIKNLKSLGIYDKVRQINFYDSELGLIYKGSKVFVFPSLYEGFGIPTLEAMKCGCPVILSKTSCMQEVAGDAAIYFQPNDNESLIRSIKNILVDNEFKNRLIEKASERVKLFTWEKTAMGYLDAIKSISK